MITTAARILDLLQEHRGRDYAISAPDICRQLRMSIGAQRDVRRIIAAHANNIWPGVLCAVPGDGYFFATDMDEIVTYREYLVGLSKEARRKLALFDASVSAAGFALKETA